MQIGEICGKAVFFVQTEKNFKKKLLTAQVYLVEEIISSGQS